MFLHVDWFPLQISVRKVLLDRTKTKNLGRCTDKQLYLFNEADYTRDYCMIECLVQVVWRQCHCLARKTSMIDLQRLQQMLNRSIPIPRETFHGPCFEENGSSRFCERSIYNSFTSDTNSHYCHDQCPVECLRKRYEYDVSCVLSHQCSGHRKHFVRFQKEARKH